MTPADPVLSELGRKLRAQRHGRGMTVKELAVKSSLSERFVVSVEGGQGNLSLLRLVELARALGCRSPIWWMTRGYKDQRRASSNVQSP